MTKNPKFKDDYVAFMDNLFEKGYAEKVPECELDQDDGRVWYIPHHGVMSPNNGTFSNRNLISTPSKLFAK
jgi:hypothetical protein